MANFCPNCGNAVSSNDAYCDSCGSKLTANETSGAYSSSTTTGSASNTANTVLGTLVAVTLLGGITRNLYYRGGRYFLDPYCRNPFHGSIVGPHRAIGGGPRGRVPMHGGPGPRGGRMGGPHGGGPRR